MRCQAAKRRARNRRVIIQRVKSSATATDHGGVDLTVDANWETVDTQFAQVKPKSSREQVVGEQIVVTTSTDFNFRYNAITAAITGEYRLKYDGDIYQIGNAINKDEANSEIIITGMKAGS
jgi:head-tail adaptor